MAVCTCASYPGLPSLPTRLSPRSSAAPLALRAVLTPDLPKAPPSLLHTELELQEKAQTSSQSYVLNVLKDRSQTGRRPRLWELRGFGYSGSGLSRSHEELQGHPEQTPQGRPQNPLAGVEAESPRPRLSTPCLQDETEGWSPLFGKWERPVLVKRSQLSPQPTVALMSEEPKGLAQGHPGPSCWGWKPCCVHGACESLR